jgi:hypothetical protein
MRLTNMLKEAFVRAAMDDVPKIDYDEKLIQAVTDEAVRQLPPKVRALYNDKDLRHFVKTNRDWHGGVSIHYPGEEIKLPETVAAEIKQLEELKDAQSDARSDLRSKLKAIAESCTTRKALAAALPEFEKYLPADDAAACRTLPAVANVVSDFMKAGWPKGATPSAT